MERAEITALFDKYIKKLRITPAWDVRLELVEDPAWRKTGDFKIDCDDKKAILMLNVVNPTQENMEEVIIHELMHIKMYPLDQVTESLITNCFEEGTAVSPLLSRQWRNWQNASCMNLVKTKSFPMVGAVRANHSTTSMKA